MGGGNHNDKTDNDAFYYNGEFHREFASMQHDYIYRWFGLKTTKKCVVFTFREMIQIWPPFVFQMCQGIGKDVPRSQRTPVGNPYILPI